MAKTYYGDRKTWYMDPVVRARREAEAVEIDYDVLVRQTGKAWLLQIDDKQVWIPLSQIVSSDVENKKVRVTEWIAREKGLI